MCYIDLILIYFASTRVQEPNYSIPRATRPEFLFFPDFENHMSVLVNEVFSKRFLFFQNLTLQKRVSKLILILSKDHFEIGSYFPEARNFVLGSCVLQYSTPQHCHIKSQIIWKLVLILEKVKRLKRKVNGARPFALN